MDLSILKKNMWNLDLHNNEIHYISPKFSLKSDQSSWVDGILLGIKFLQHLIPLKRQINSPALRSLLANKPFFVWKV